MTKKHILFVDDNVEFLRAIQESLRIAEPNWSVTFTGNPEEAMDHVSKTGFDVVVADYQMPQMDGVVFLEKVQEAQPGAMRFLVSGELTPDDVLRIAFPAHQCFSKPVDIDLLRRTIRKVSALRDLMGNDVLKRLVAQCSLLPTVPNLYLELANELKSPVASIRQIELIISRDPAIAAKILQLVNSSFFGLPRKIESLGEAVNYVGVQIIKALALTVPVFSRFEGVRVKDYSPTAIWEHCWRTGVLARALAQEEDQPRSVCEDAFLAGLLHDLGKMILVANLSPLCREATALSAKKQIPTHVAEREIFGCSHAMVAAYLLGLWGIPESIIEAVGFHNDPLEAPSTEFNALAAVHAANALDHACSEGKP
ncbi:MAG: HDOD domain-containing protein [Verrucomicrobia bacterium]|nr:HDOD domain-containing protein [Verrucomicrobiota bacterium]